MRVRVLSGIAAAGMALALPAVAAAQGPVIDPLPGAATLHVLVGPRTIGTHTNVLVRFRQPVSTGYVGSERSIEALEISGPSPRRACIGSRRVVLAAAPEGTMIRHRLHPRWLGGRWCTGVYRGRLTYQVQSACAPGPVRVTAIACPMFIMAPRTLATFHFRVTTAR